MADFFVEFRFDSVDRKFTMPALPRVGDLVDFYEDDEHVVLRIKTLVHIFDHGHWSYHCNCDRIKDWLA